MFRVSFVMIKNNEKIPKTILGAPCWFSFSVNFVHLPKTRNQWLSETGVIFVCHGWYGECISIRTSTQVHQIRICLSLALRWVFWKIIFNTLPKCLISPTKSWRRLKKFQPWDLLQGILCRFCCFSVSFFTLSHTNGHRFNRFCFVFVFQSFSLAAISLMFFSACLLQILVRSSSFFSFLSGFFCASEDMVFFSMLFAL